MKNTLVIRDAAVLSECDHRERVSAIEMILTYIATIYSNFIMGGRHTDTATTR